MLDGNHSQAELTKSIPEFGNLSPRLPQELSTLPPKLALGEKVRQLVSVGMAVTTRGDDCITFRTDAVLQAGATKQEIAEALGVPMAMNAGAALVYSPCLASVGAQARKPSGQRPPTSSLFVPIR